MLFRSLRLLFALEIPLVLIVNEVRLVTGANDEQGRLPSHHVSLGTGVTSGELGAPHHRCGPGHGFIDSYDVNGNFLSRIATQGALNSPWGLVIAPSGFENVGGDLLVGNFGDGTINAYNLTTHASDGPLKNLSNNPITIGGLWALTVGNGGQAGNNKLIYFTAGPNGETNGLFGSLASVPEPSTYFLILIATCIIARPRWRRGPPQ